MKAGSPKDAQQAAQALEAYFMRQFLSEVKTDGMTSGVGGDTFHDMFNEAIADAMSKGGGIGLADQIVAQLDENSGASKMTASARGAANAAFELPRSTTHAAFDTGMPLERTAGRPIALPRGMAVYRQAAEMTPGMTAPGATTAMTPMAGLEGLTVRPVDGRITSRMGERIDPINGQHDLHPGVDLAAARGTPVHAAGPGKVVRAGEASGYGNLVVVDHGGGMETRYAHLDHIDVKVGDQIEAGNVVGEAGATGRVTGPHLHFEVRQDGHLVDPTPALRRPAPAPAAAQPVETAGASENLSPSLKSLR